MEVVGKRHAPAALPSGKRHGTHCPLFVYICIFTYQVKLKLSQYRPGLAFRAPGVGEF